MQPARWQIRNPSRGSYYALEKHEGKQIKRGLEMTSLPEAGGNWWISRLTSQKSPRFRATFIWRSTNGSILRAPEVLNIVPAKEDAKVVEFAQAAG